ncbi:MAG: hypothetical protein IJZ53_08025 [Tyzzerella sp.]|nr:hypothetical protein [Tyzzerella sp.]
MNRKYSIGFLIGIIIIMVLFIIVYQFSYSRAVEENEKQRSETKLEEGYYIKEIDGYVTVYLADGKTVYEYTSILVEELPLEIRQELNTGIKVETLGEVYGFLENYSS